MTIAVIPARGGSKRIPRKNIRMFAGRPMLHHAIDLARATGLFARILVSTDDPEIADIARAGGVETPFERPAELADDHADTASVMAHAVTSSGNALADTVAVCCLYPATPLLLAADLAEALAVLKSTNSLDYVFAATRFSHPVQRGFLRQLDGGVAPLFPEHRGTRSQDLPVVYHDAGQFYWGTAAAWRAKRPIFDNASRFIELPPWRAQDIDTEDDWQMAERLYAASGR